MLATNLKNTGRYRSPKQKGPIELQPAHLNDLRKCLDPALKAPLPIRPRGAGTASTDCNSSAAGTTLRMTGMSRIVRIDPADCTVTAEAGVPLDALVATLAEDGFELVGGYELQGRTVGGAVAAPCFGACIGDNGSYFSSHVVAMKVVTADGRLLNIEPEKKNLLGAFRLSFGLLGVIYEVTLRIRPSRTFSASHRRVTINKFAEIVDTLARSDVGFKFYLMPYRDRVYLDLRRYESVPGNTYKVPWKIKDWGESTVLPHVFRSLNRVMPIQSVKYNLIDTISEATQSLVNSRLVTTGSNAASQSNQSKRAAARTRYYSTWCFPAANFSMIAKAYQEFCATIYAESAYRCDLPAVGYRLCRDTTSPISPSFDETMIALTTASTQLRGWEDFVIDLAEFAEQWGGTPMISQSRALRAEYAIQAYAHRLDFFRRTRRQLDPRNRLLSPFLAQFCQ
ncbi:MAG: FAD-binding oxidoreductase [Gammaproteobacteria bacterium]|nr:FAD-binding oxidoreductase [Gammaproteobacteria bacterium]